LRRQERLEESQGHRKKPTDHVSNQSNHLIKREVQSVRTNQFHDYSHEADISDAPLTLLSACYPAFNALTNI
jgi:hypothetical protein